MDALPATLNLAAAGNMQLGRSADIVSNVMQGFGIEASRTAEVTDIMTKTFTSSNTNLEQLGEAMSYAAPVARGFGQSVESTAAAIGILSDAGIQASRAGTGLRRVFTYLSKKSDDLGVAVFDSSGNMRNLADILADLEKQGMSSAEMMEVFGMRGGPIMQVLLDRGADALKNFTGELENAGGTAERVAETQMEGLKGAWIEMRSAISELMISFIEPLSGMLEGLVDKIKTWAQRFANLSTHTKKVVLVIGALTAALGPLMLILGKLLSPLAMIPKLLIGLMNPVGLVIGLVTALAAAVLYIWDNWAAVKERITDWGWWKNLLINMLQELARFAVKMLDLLTWPIRKAAEFFGAEVPTLEASFGGMIDKMDKWKTDTKDFEHDFKSFGDTIKSAINKGLDAIGLFEGKMATASSSTEEAADKAEEFSRNLDIPQEQLSWFDAFSQKADLSANKLAKMNMTVQTTSSNSAFALDLLGDAFNGMQNSITQAVQGSQNILKSFWKFFVDFIKGMIVKLMTAVAITVLLGAALAALGLGGMGGIIGGISKAGGLLGTQNIAGMLTGLQHGTPEVTRAGAFKVGESGPEIVTLPAGAAVSPTSGTGGGNYEEQLLTSLTGQQVDIILNRFRKDKRRTTGR
jgi:TP901 family phage tail tape measure protein